VSIDPWTIALEVVNFLVLVWLLERLLYRPVLGVIAGREAEIERLRSADADAQAALAAEHARLEDARADVAAERARLLEEAHAQALEEQRRLSAAARAEAERLLADGRARLAHERAEAERELRRKSADLAVGIARGLLAASTPGDGDARFVDAACAHLEALAPAERARIADSLADGKPVDLRSARPLAPAEQDACRTRVAHALGRGAEVRFGVDQTLIEGVEIGFPGLVLRHSWRDALESCDAALRADADGGAGHGEDT